MMSSIFYGEIKEERLNSWSENENPYDILKENNRINSLSGWDFLEVAKKLFTEEVQVDWGSFLFPVVRSAAVPLKITAISSEEEERWRSWRLRSRST